MEKKWRCVVVGDKASGRTKVLNAIRKELFLVEIGEDNATEYSKYIDISIDQINNYLMSK